MADTRYPTLEPQRTPSDLVVSAADLLAGRVSPDDAIVLLDGLLTSGHGAAPPVRSDAEPTDCLLWHAPSVVAQLWPDRWVTRTSALSRVLGYPPDLPHHREPLTLVHPPDRGDAMRAYVEAITGRSARCTVPLRVRAADGGLRLFETTFVGSDTASGHPSVVVYMQDMTGWHADHARLRELVSQLNHGVMVVDEAGYVRLANDALTRMFGSCVAQWVDQHEGEFLRWLVTSCRDMPRAGQQVTALVAARDHRALRLHLADGRTVHLHRTPVTDASLAHGALWRFWDVPAPVRARDTRSEARPGGQPRVLATVSHELKSIARLAEVLANLRTRPSRKQWRTATEAIARDTKRVLTVVDDLLLLSRLDSGDISLRSGEVPVPELVRAAVADRTAEASAAGVVLACRTGRGPSVVGDGDWLRRALDNLVRSALKFSAKGSTITVSARYEGTRWSVMVAGRGIGIPATDLERVSRGFGGDTDAAGANGIPGNGLGLVICRRLVELHQGELTVGSTVDSGTTVRVTIPVRRTM